MTSRHNIPRRAIGVLHTLDSLAALCVEEGDCLLWRGAMSRGNKPVIRHEGRVVPVRRYIFTELLGREVPPGKLISHNCASETCIAQEHVAAMTRSEMMAHTAARTQFHRRPDYRARLSMAAIRRSPYDEALLQRIRQASGSFRQIARDMGLSRWLVADVQMLRRRAPVNPFSGLGSLASNDEQRRRA